MKHLGFVRIGGSLKELKSMSLLSQELEVPQIYYELESCEVRANDVSPLELKILEPYDVLEIDLSGSRQMQNRFD
ncbi:MAG: hypothetical protein J6D33_10975 [Turicibacter sp.]|nr:hypothetical protein [Turicibacter sp.]